MTTFRVALLLLRKFIFQWEIFLGKHVFVLCNTFELHNPDRENLKFTLVTRYDEKKQKSLTQTFFFFFHWSIYHSNEHTPSFMSLVGTFWEEPYQFFSFFGRFLWIITKHVQIRTELLILIFLLGFKRKY